MIRASVRADQEGMLVHVSLHTGTGVSENILATADLVDAGMCFFGDKDGIEFQRTKSGPPVFVTHRKIDRRSRFCRSKLYVIFVPKEAHSRIDKIRRSQDIFTNSSASV